MRVADPLLPDPDTETQIEDALARALCLKGVALKDAQILRRMDAGDPPLSIQKALNADGSFDKRAPLAELEDLKNLIGHAESQARQWAEKMRAGDIAAKPLCDKNLAGPCEHCACASICRLEKGDLRSRARVMRDVRFDELLDAVHQHASPDGETPKNPAQN